MGTIAKYVAVLLIGLVIGFVFGMLVVEKSAKTGTITVIDTIPYYKPVAKDSLVVRYETVKLPAVRDTVRDSHIYKDTLVHDSVNVILPITQKKYTERQLIKLSRRSRYAGALALWAVTVTEQKELRHSSAWVFITDYLIYELNGQGYGQQDGCPKGKPCKAA